MKALTAFLLFCAAPLLALAAAGRTAAPAAGVVLSTAENMYSRPTAGSDVVSQALLGTNVRILRAAKNPDGGEWYNIETPDTYRGWIAASALRLIREGEWAYASRGKIFAVTALMAYVYAEPDVTARRPLTAAPISAVLEVRGRRNARWIEIMLPSGAPAWVQNGDGELRDAPMFWPRLAPEALIALAKRFVGLPYLWGGMSPLGLDCSGFAQLIYRMGGIPILRDADIQFEGSGLLDVPHGSEAVGDLVFFGPVKDKITHVGMIIGAGEFISATTHEKPVVQISQLADPYWRGLYRGARRPAAAGKKGKKGPPRAGPIYRGCPCPPRLFSGRFLGFLLLLGLLLILGADELQNGQRRPVSHPPVELHDPRVSAWPFRKPRGDLVEELPHRGLFCQIGQSLAPGVKRPPLSEGDHLLGHRLGRLGLGQRRGDTLTLDERRHQIAEQGPPVGRIPSQVSLLDLMPHSSCSLPVLTSLISARMRSMSLGWSSRLRPRFRFPGSP